MAFRHGFAHLNLYKVGYFIHMWRALKFGVRCFFWTCEVFIHALHPDCFTNTSVKMKAEIKRLEEGCQDPRAFTGFVR